MRIACPTVEPLGLFAFFIVVLMSASIAGAEETKRFPFKSYLEVAELFEKLNYTPDAWQSGIRSVPRVYISHIPPRWSETTSREVSAIDKKRIFFRVLAPLVLRSNELIEKERSYLLAFLGKRDQSKEVARRINELMVRYRVGVNGGIVGKELIAELKQRIDIVPVSLALAQAAEESGWGTSRFAKLGNAVFGQWAWDGKGIKPKEQRAGKGDYRIAAFESPQSSVQSYMLNINTNPAYADFRRKRAEMRQARKLISGWELAETLTRYSERGNAYVKSLQELMRVNRLVPTDEAFLADGTTYVLIPVGPGAK